jgi:hypothetical protein
VSTASQSGPGHPAGTVEVAAVAAVALVVWYLALGWDWSVVPDGTPNGYRDPHTALDWSFVYLVAVAGTGWLAWRGRAVAGAFAVATPLVVLSGWRMAVATVIGANLWPVGLAAFAVTLGGACAVTALVGGWLRRRGTAVAGGRRAGG